MELTSDLDQASQPEVQGRSRGSSGTQEPLIVRQAVKDLLEGPRKEAGFRVLFETYHPAVRRFFAGRLRRTEECLDLTQETFLRVYRGVGGYRGDGPFAAWLFRIAWNVLHRHRSRAAGKASRQVPLEDLQVELPEAAGKGEAPSARDEGQALRAVLHAERVRTLRRAISKLPDQRRKCVILWAYRGLTYEETAVALRLSLGTVKAHLAQARKQLESLVEEVQKTIP